MTRLARRALQTQSIFNFGDFYIAMFLYFRRGFRPNAHGRFIDRSRRCFIHAWA